MIFTMAAQPSCVFGHLINLIRQSLTDPASLTVPSLEPEWDKEHVCEVGGERPVREKLRIAVFPT